MSRILKIGLVGAGMFGGDVHLRTYCQLQQNGILPWLGRLGLDNMARALGDIEVDFVALATNTPGSCARKLEEYGKHGMSFATYHGDTPWLDLLDAHPDLDILAVATPDHLHAAPILAALPDNPRVVVSGNFATPKALLATFDAAVPTYVLHALNAQPGLPDREGVTFETTFVGPGISTSTSLMA